MKDSTEEPNHIRHSLNEQEVLQFFLKNVNKVYFAKAHLAERLPELAEQADFRDLKNAVLETSDDVKKQLARIEEIYILLNAEPSIENCDDLVGFIEDGYDRIYQQGLNSKLRDLSILFYMSLIESVEMASFKILLMAAKEIPGKHIQQLLQENFDESKAGRKLFMQITSKFI